jgi:hypothetical protein
MKISVGFFPHRKNSPKLKKDPDGVLAIGLKNKNPQDH